MNDALIQQLGIAGVVVGCLIGGLRWMAAMFKDANTRAIALHDKCEQRQEQMVVHFEELQIKQLDRNSHAMHAMAKALDNIAIALNDTRTPSRPLKVPTAHDIFPPHAP